MNDIVFYWVAWACWIWAACMMEKGKIRTQIAVFSLIAIICSNYTCSIADYSVNVAIIFFLLLSIYCIITKHLAKQIYLVFIAAAAALGYASIVLLSIFDPVLVILPINIMTTIFLLIIASIVAKQLIDKLFIIFFSTAIGEIIIGIIFGQLRLQSEIGMNQYLTRIAVPFAILAMFQAFKTMLMKNKYI